MAGPVRRVPFVLRQLPNALSVARITCAPVLVAFAVLGHDRAFTWLLIPALLTDAVDGWIARGLRLESRIGARLDSVGDSLLWSATLAGVVLLRGDVVVDNAWLIGTVVAFWVLESAVAWWRYRRLSSFHTYASKAAGVLLSVYVGVLFVFGHLAWLLGLAAGASIAANLEELLLLRWCHEWRTDVRGAWWVWREGACATKPAAEAMSGK